MFTILISGSTLTASIELAYLKGLRLTACKNVQIVKTDNNYTNLTLFFRIYRRLSPNRHVRILEYNKTLSKELNKREPGDVLLIFKGMDVSPETLRMAKKKGLFIVNYNPDHPFIFSGRGSGNTNVRDGIKWFDLYLTYSQEAKQDLERNNIQSAILPFGFENSIWMGNDILENEEIKACCFVGNPDSIRISFIQEFSKTIPLHLYGTGWSDKDFNDNVTIHKAVAGIEFYQTLRKYRVQLNLMRPHNLNSHNMRTFDVTGCGGIGLMPRTMDHDHFFTDTEELFLYTGATDAEQKATQILELNYEEAITIRRSARRQALRLGADYKSRAQLMFNTIVEARLKPEKPTHS